MNKLYNVILGDVHIGTTLLEHADPPMGVVFGRILFFDTPSPYTFFKEYATQNQLDFKDYPDDKLISVYQSADLKVITPNHIEIKSVGNSIEGMDSDGYYVTLLGVTYPIYDEEFPHHVENYYNPNSRK